MDKYNFGPNVIYFALGITETRPAGAFWVDKIVFGARKASRRLPFGRIKFADPSCVLDTLLGGRFTFPPSPLPPLDPPFSAPSV